jgi:citrate/tricarballylate utilization protein
VQESNFSIMNLGANEKEVSRMLHICNGCRYCEGFCAVFPAMARRLEFNQSDVHYLANLCHNCGACLHACQYAPPHEFAVNIPKGMAALRKTTYIDYAWPQAMGQLYQRNGLFIALTLSTTLAFFLGLSAYLKGGLFWAPTETGNFYQAFSHNTLVWMFGLVFGFIFFAMAMSIAKFIKNSPLEKTSCDSIQEAVTSIATLKYLDGGHGEGCNEESDGYTKIRRVFHHFTFYGFLLCFAATSVATLYHYFLGYPAPYPYLSLPVILGTLGGLGLMIGPAGLLYLKFKRHPLHGDPSQKGMDVGFITLLWLTGFSGLLILALRDTFWMPLTLSIHLGCVMAFFITMPYGKFMHGIYRGVALLKWAIEKRLPTNLKLGSD